VNRTSDFEVIVDICNGKSGNTFENLTFQISGKKPKYLPDPGFVSINEFEILSYDSVRDRSTITYSNLAIDYEIYLNQGIEERARNGKGGEVIILGENQSD
jgi:hypothetical protein